MKTAKFPKFGPKKSDHPSIGEICQVCGKAFKEGDYTTLFIKRQVSDDLAEAQEIHFECAPIYE